MFILIGIINLSYRLIIYPCVIQVNKGKLQQYAFQSPKTPALYNLEKLLKQQHKE